MICGVVHSQETRVIGTEQFNASFVGSFPSLKFIPRDRRPEVAIAGRSNVGKSSLLNKLVGQKKLAKVSQTPGKTRALNYFMIDDRFYLVDLPGYGYAKVSKKIKEAWGELIETYLTQCETLIGHILLLDARRDPTIEDQQLLQWLEARQLPTMLVLTKADKLTRNQLNQKLAKTERELGLPAIASSIKTGQGKRELARAVMELVNESSTR